jgi:hypothetical protein
MTLGRTTLDPVKLGQVRAACDRLGEAGAALRRRPWREIVDVLGDHVDAGEWTLDDAVRVGGMIGRGNAARVYGLPTEGDRP